MSASKKTIGYAVQLAGIGAFAVGAILTIFVLIMAALSAFSPYPPNQTYVVPPDIPPSWQYLFGTTSRGQDTFWQVTFALRNSLLFGFSVALIRPIDARGKYPNQIFPTLAAGTIRNTMDKIYHAFEETGIVLACHANGDSCQAGLAEALQRDFCAPAIVVADLHRDAQPSA